MKLLLDEMTLRFVWGSSGEYWYSRIDSQIHSSAELECADTEDLMANGFIPFLTISNEEVIRAYIKFLDNKKVSAVLEKLSGNEYGLGPDVQRPLCCFRFWLCAVQYGIYRHYGGGNLGNDQN